MELIIQKSIKYSVNDFFNKIIYLDYIDGIALNIFKTKDNVLITFNLINNQESLLQNIYNSTYDNLQNLDIDLTKPNDVLFIYSINVINNSFSLK